MKKNIWKKTLSLAMAGITALSLTACGGGNSGTAAPAGQGDSKQTTAESAQAEGEQKVITFMHRFPDEPYNTFINTKLAEYEQMHPDIKFNIISAQNQEYKEKIKIVVGSEDTPDIFLAG